MSQTEGMRRRLTAGRVAGVSAILLALRAGALGAQADAHAHGSPSGPAPARLGTVTFPTSASARAQPMFVRGIALLHSFHYEEAAKAFQGAERADAAFALPYWFEAFTHSHLLWGEDDPAAARAVLARLGPTRAARLARAASPRERAFAAAIEAFYADTSVEVRTRAFADSMRRLTTSDPADLEAAAFTSLALMMAIDQGAYSPEETTARSGEMIELAERVFRASPNHPGAAHYLIHASDIDPSFTQRSLPAARAYARIAPDASHALHMPSHVFLRLGLWDEVATSNERSWAAWRREMARDHLSGGEIDAHSLQFLAYAYLESGRWRAARALIDSARRVMGNSDLSIASHVDARYAISRLSFLVALETGQWKDVIPPPPDRAPLNQRDQGFIAVARYARAVTLAMRGDTAALAASVARLRHEADSLGAAAPFADYRASGLEGILARARGDQRRAIERLVHAAEFEDQLPQVGPPSFLFARELLADVYRAAGQTTSAAAQWDRALVNAPNRSASLLELARARLALGDSTGAKAMYARLLKNWAAADPDIPGLLEARAGAAGRFAR